MDFDMSFLHFEGGLSSSHVCHIRDIENGTYIKKSDFDLDVYLPTFGINLQRPFVWTPLQQSAFMESIVYYRHRTIPNFAILKDDSEDKERTIWRVVDGKQRLTTIFKWLNGEVSISVPGFEGTIETCPPILKQHIGRFAITANICYDGRAEKVVESDLDDVGIVKWFDLINFTGTPQDLEHKQKLRSLID
jgi:hypothetical protein